jgi:hypothetical protein
MCEMLDLVKSKIGNAETSEDAELIQLAALCDLLDSALNRRLIATDWVYGSAIYKKCMTHRAAPACIGRKIERRKIRDSFFCVRCFCHIRIFLFGRMPSVSDY